MDLDIREANIIEQALHSQDGTVLYWTSHVTHQLISKLKRHGMRLVGFAPDFPNGNRRFWSMFAVDNRELAETAVIPFRQINNPISFHLTNFEQDGYWANYVCPECGSNDLKWHDGDSVFVPVLPEGITSYDEIDTFLTVGTCQDCQQPLYVYEFGFSSIPNPDDSSPFMVPNLEQIPDHYQMYRAEADGLEPWIVSRLWYNTGRLDSGCTRLPKGPFVVDLHQFGPFHLAEEGELSGLYGVLRCASGGNDKWTVGQELFRRLAANAMAKLRSADNIGKVQKMRSRLTGKW